MAKRFYTVLVLPDATSPPRKFRIQRFVLTLLSVFLALLVLGFGFFTYQYVNLNVRMLEFKRLRQEVQDRNVLAQKVSHLDGELTRLRDLDRRLRVATGLDKADAQKPVLAQGGADALSRVALREAVKERTGRLADWVNRDLEVLGQEITSRERSFHELNRLLQEKRSLLAATPTISPVKGLITAEFGYRRSPFTGRREFHEGVDIAAPAGTPILATADGVVSFAGPMSDYGKVVFIDHGHGLATFYAHDSRIRVREGQLVKRGDVIAYVGSTGRTTGPHVHYEVHLNGAVVNPLKYIIDMSDMRYAGEQNVKDRS